MTAITLAKLAAAQLKALPKELVPETALIFTATVQFEGRKPFVRKHLSIESARNDVLKLLRGHYAYAQTNRASAETLHEIVARAKLLDDDETVPLCFEAPRFKVDFWVTIERAKLGQNGSVPF